MQHNADTELTLIEFPEGNSIEYTYEPTGPDSIRRGNLTQVRRVAGPRGNPSPGASPTLITAYEYTTSIDFDPANNNPDIDSADFLLTQDERDQRIALINFVKRTKDPLLHETAYEFD